MYACTDTYVVIYCTYIRSMHVYTYVRTYDIIDVAMQCYGITKITSNDHGYSKIIERKVTC